MSKAKIGFLGVSIATGALLLVGIGGCSDVRHPLDRQLAQIKPVTVTALQGLDWPTGTLLCPLSPYQSALRGDSDVAQRVNAFLQKSQFQGDEGHWSLVVVKPGAEIEQLIFERGKYDVVTSLRPPDEATQLVIDTFTLKECVAVQQVRILATSGGALNRPQISFGTAE